MDVKVHQNKKKWNIFTIMFICFDYCIYSDCSGPQVALVYMIWKWNKLCVAMELLHVYEHLVQPATQLCSKRAWQIKKAKIIIKLNAQCHVFEKKSCQNNMLTYTTLHVSGFLM